MKNHDVAQNFEKSSHLFFGTESWVRFRIALMFIQLNHSTQVTFLQCVAHTNRYNICYTGTQTRVSKRGPKL